MKASLILIGMIGASVFLSGCSTTAIGKIGMFDNRVSCTLDGKHLLFNSMYGPIGVTAKVEDADSQVVCSSKQPSVQTNEGK